MGANQHKWSFASKLQRYVVLKYLTDFDFDGSAVRTAKLFDNFQSGRIRVGWEG